MIRIAVVEDELTYQQQLTAYIEQYGNLHSNCFQVTVFDDGLEILENYSGQWDIIFMDIKMKHTDGMTAAKKIRALDQHVVIIFITTLAKYAIKGYEVDALDFVLKPLLYSQFEVRMKKALTHLTKREGKHLLLSNDEVKERVSTDDILFIEVKSHMLYIVTMEKTYTMRYPLQEMERELAAYHFIRCNHCYLVNLKNIMGIQKDKVKVGQHLLQISRPKKKEFLQAVSDYFGSGYKI